VDCPDRLSKGQRHQHEVVSRTRFFALKLEDRTLRTIPRARAVTAGCLPVLELELWTVTERFRRKAEGALFLPR